MTTQNKYKGAFEDGTVRMFRAIIRDMDFSANDFEDCEQISAVVILSLKRRKPYLDEVKDKALFRKAIFRKLSKYRKYLQLRTAQVEHNEVEPIIRASQEDIPLEVLEIVEKLPKEERAVFVLRWSGFTYEEVAQNLKISDRQVKNSIRRLQDAFRQ